MLIKINCINCNIDFEKEFKHRHRKFCSRKCFFQYSKEHKLLGRNFDSDLREIRQCVFCNTDFEVKKKNIKKLCSNECRKKWNLIESNKLNRITLGKEKLIKTYGVDSVFKLKDFKDGVKNVFLSKYGVTNPMFKTEFVENLKTTLREKQLINLLPKLNLFGLKLLDDYSKNKNGKTSISYKFECLKCNSIFSSTVLGSGKIPICRKCNPLLNSSNLEIGVREFMDDNSLNYILNDRKTLNGLEIDLLIPSNKIGLEINGNYYHSERYGQKNKLYHLNKTELGYTKNIKIIHIFEDEIIYKKDIVLSRLRNLLNLNTNKIYARKCELKTVDKKESTIFLNENHIQGNCVDKYRFGLYYNGELVSLITFGNERMALGGAFKSNVFELVRFCNKLNTNVVGGFSKLLKHFSLTYKPTKLITYADIRWSGLDYKNTVYFKNGFTFIKNTPPNYWYLKVGEFNNRFHRFNFRKDVLIKEGFDNNLTENEIMTIKGYDRIWDCGTMKFELINLI
jgi:hypothetical protein